MFSSRFLEYLSKHGRGVYDQFVKVYEEEETKTDDEDDTDADNDDADNKPIADSVGGEEEIVYTVVDDSDEVTPSPKKLPGDGNGGIEPYLVRKPRGENPTEGGGKNVISPEKKKKQPASTPLKRGSAGDSESEGEPSSSKGAAGSPKKLKKM